MQKINKILNNIAKLFFGSIMFLGLVSTLLLLIALMTPLTPTRAVGISMTGEDAPNFINYCWESENLNLDRGDIIIFKPLEAGIEDELKEYIGDLSILENENFLKRIIAIEGDTVEIKDGILLLNGKEILETYTIDNFSGKDMEKVIVPKGRVFVAGDYRYNSLDSRRLGPIKRESITAEVIVYNNKYLNRVTDGFYEVLLKLGVET